MEAVKSYNNKVGAAYKGSMAVYGLIPVILVYVGKIHEIFPSLSAIHLGKVTFVLVALLYLASFERQSHVSMLSFTQVWCVIGVSMLGMASIPFSVWPGGSFRFFFYSHIKTIVFFFFLIKILNTKEDMKKALWGFSIAIFLLGFAVLNVSGEGRVSVGMTYDSNDLALVMVSSMPFIYYMMGGEKGLKRLFLLTTFALMIYAVIRTGSRGGFLGLLTVSAIILLKERKRGLLKAVTAVVIIGGFLYFAPTTFWNRISTMGTITEDYNMTGSEGRIASWKRGLELMAKNPVLGSGIGAFTAAAGKEFEGTFGAWNTAHNSFIQIGAETGVAGLALFILMIAAAIKSARSYRTAFETHPEFSSTVWIANGVEVGLYGYIVSGFFLSQAYSAHLIFLVGTTVILGRLWKSSCAEGKPPVVSAVPSFKGGNGAFGS